MAQQLPHRHIPISARDQDKAVKCPGKFRSEDVAVIFMDLREKWAELPDIEKEKPVFLRCKKPPSELPIKNIVRNRSDKSNDNRIEKVDVPRPDQNARYDKHDLPLDKNSPEDEKISEKTMNL